MAESFSPLKTLSALVRAVDNADSITQIRQGMIMHSAREIIKRLRRSETTSPPWTPFQRAEPLPPTEEQIALVRKHMPTCDARAAADLLVSEFSALIYVNSRYQVLMRTVSHAPNPAPGEWLIPPGEWVYLSIKRIDQQPIHDWRDLQRIKNELVGPQCEAIELYPAEERLLDAANQYHLWVSPDPKFRFPVGCTERLVIDSDDDGPAVQRAL
jgi:hypothetical protein